MKEHISSVQRQKEQDQKKLMKEYLEYYLYAALSKLA